MNAYVISLFVLASLLVGCGSDKNSPESSSLNQIVIANIGSEQLFASELAARLEKRNSGVAPELLKQQVLDELIDRKVQVFAAKEAGYASDPEIISAIENLLITKLRQQHLKDIIAAVAVSDAEVATYYQDNEQKYTTPPMVRGAMIRLDLPFNATDEARAKVYGQAEMILALAQTQPPSVAGFGALAARYSEDQASRYSGGDMGWVSTAPSIADSQGHNKILLDALTQLKNKGDLAPIVNTKEAVYLLKLLDKKPEQKQPLSLVASNIKQRLLRQKQQQAELDWVQSLRASVTPLNINQKALALINLAANTNTTPDQRPPSLPR